METDQTPEQQRRRLLMLATAWQRGEIRLDALGKSAYRLLNASCSGCREDRPRERPTRLDELPAPVTEALERLVALVDGAPDGWDAALGEIAAGGAERYGAAQLAAALLVKARDELPGDPARSGRWAQLAAAVAGLGGGAEHRERLAQAMAYRGNAVRAAQSEGLAAAEPWFAGARWILEREGGRSVEVGAEVDRLHGTLLKDQLRFGAAVRRFRRAIACYVTLGEERMVARVALSLSLTYSFAQDRASAMELARTALTWSGQAGDTAQRALALLHLAALSEVEGRLEIAHAMTRQAWQLGVEQDSALGLHLSWTDVLIAAHGGSERAYEELWALYACQHEADSPYDALAQLLHIARLVSIHRKYGEMPKVAHEVARLEPQVPEYHGKVRQALAGLRRQLVDEALTPALALQYSLYLRLARRDPHLAVSALGLPSIG